MWLSDNNQSLLVDQTNNSVYQNQSFYDNGRYIPNISAILFEKQGNQNISSNSQNSLILTETFSRNTSSAACVAKSSKEHTDCIESMVDEIMSCQNSCDDTRCIINCNSSEFVQRPVCTQELIKSCGDCYGDVVKAPSSLYGDYDCIVNTIWSSTVNNGQTLLLRGDNTVRYIMFDGTQDTGTYNKSTNVITLTLQGVKNIIYDSLTDTMTVSVNMKNVPNQPLSVLDSRIFSTWEYNNTPSLVINRDGTITYLDNTGNHNGKIGDIVDSSNFKVEYDIGYRTYRYDPSYNIITDIEDNKVFQRFRPT